MPSHLLCCEYICAETASSHLNTHICSSVRGKQTKKNTQTNTNTQYWYEKPKNAKINAKETCLLVKFARNIWLVASDSSHVNKQMGAYKWDCVWRARVFCWLECARKFRSGKPHNMENHYNNQHKYKHFARISTTHALWLKYPPEHANIIKSHCSTIYCGRSDG